MWLSSYSDDKEGLGEILLDQSQSPTAIRDRCIAAAAVLVPQLQPQAYVLQLLLGLNELIAQVP